MSEGDARAGQGGVQERQVKLIGTDEPAQRSAYLERGQWPTLDEPTAEIPHDVTQRCPQLHLIRTGPGESPLRQTTNVPVSGFVRGGRR